MRETLRAAFTGALAAVDLTARVARAMPATPRGVRRGLLLAVGKASPAMARGALPAVDARIARALVVAPDGTEAELDDPRVELMRASHPDPDARSVAAGRRAMELVRQSDYVIALVSGGASSLICLPRGVSLARYVRVVRALLLGGATAREVNLVRRHLCAVKGGGLARRAAGPVRTLIASDVIRGEAQDVGSGPTAPDPTTCAQARAVLRRHAPRLALPPLHESLKPTSAAARGLRVRFVARPQDLARALAGELQARLDSVRVLEASVAPADVLAREYLARAQTLRPGQALVRSAEPSLVVDASPAGRGGRSTHLATLVARHLPQGVIFLAGASDGVDGNSGSAGAVVDATLLARVGEEAIARALAAFDTGRLLASAGMTVTLGPTGSNLADVHVLAR
jgi:hydroxypyruvate reductase